VEATGEATPIHVSSITELTAAILAIDTPKELDRRQRMWSYIYRLLASGRTLRALGSAALNMAYVAAGWVDGYFSVHMKPWDQAAGGLLVQEAGGVVTTLSGELWTPYRPDPLMAASPALLDAMRAAWEGSDLPEGAGHATAS
jgi:myo-inositol-1(or 4)-monophosphatase